MPKMDTVSVQGVGIGYVGLGRGNVGRYSSSTSCEGHASSCVYPENCVSLVGVVGVQGLRHQDRQPVGQDVYGIGPSARVV